MSGAGRGRWGGQRGRRGRWGEQGGERARPRGHAGSALLLTVVASAALTVLVATLLTSLLGAEQTLRYRMQRRQAEELAQAAARQAAAALASGSLRWPGVEAEERVVNGTRVRDGAAVPVALFPVPGRAGAPEWPPTTPAAWIDGRPSGGVGAEVTVRAITGPDGRPRGTTTAEDGSHLYALSVLAWFRRASARLEARILLQADGTVVLLR